MNQIQHPTAEQLLEMLSKQKTPARNERDLNLAIGNALARHGVEYYRECVVDADSRIDFFIPHTRVGIELKTKGSQEATERQLLRYALTGFFNALVLVTTRPGANFPSHFERDNAPPVPLFVLDLTTGNLP